MKRSEDEYRSKLLGLKAKMEARDGQIETDLREMASDFKHELARALRLASNSGNIHKKYTTKAVRLYASF